MGFIKSIVTLWKSMLQDSLNLLKIEEFIIPLTTRKPDLKNIFTVYCTSDHTAQNRQQRHEKDFSQENITFIGFPPHDKSVHYCIDLRILLKLSAQFTASICSYLPFSFYHERNKLKYYILSFSDNFFSDNLYNLHIPYSTTNVVC